MQLGTGITWLPGSCTSRIRNWLSCGEAEHLLLRTSGYRGHLEMPSPMTLDKGAGICVAMVTHRR